MEPPTRLFLLRHAEVDERYHRVFGGRIDMDLSPRGRAQAKALGDYLERVRFDAIYASPMKRVRQTLAQFNGTQPQSPIILDELREVDFGSWTGLNWDEVRERFQTSAFLWLDHLEQGSIAEAEPVAQFQQRIDLALQTVLAERAGQAVAVVCHGGVIRMLLSILLELPFRKTAAFEIEYASVTMVQHAPNKTEIQLLNFTPWRDWR